MVARKLVKAFNDYRLKCINLIPSENVLSKSAKKGLTSEFSSRYYFGDPFISESNIKYMYHGTKQIADLVSYSSKISCDLFGCNYSNVYPLSGHIANLTVLFSFSSPGDKIICTSPTIGGYPGLSSEMLPKSLGLSTDYLPYNSNFVLDLDSLQKILVHQSYKILLFSSVEIARDLLACVSLLDRSLHLVFQIFD